MLDKNYVDIDAHYVCEIAYKELNDTEKSIFHRLIIDGLIESILSSGDGESPESAFQVIDTSEEYVILSVLGLQLKWRRLDFVKGHNYDRMEVFNPESGENLVLYFNVDIPLDW